MSLPLSGLRILVVEDEFFLAADLEDALTRAGAEVVGPTADLDEAMCQVEADGFDFAVVDVNLRGRFSYELADALVAREVPFVFATAYGRADIPMRHKDRPHIEKPYDPRTLVRSLARMSESGAAQG